MVNQRKTKKKNQSKEMKIKNATIYFMASMYYTQYLVQ